MKIKAIQRACLNAKIGCTSASQHQNAHLPAEAHTTPLARVSSDNCMRALRAGVQHARDSNTEFSPSMVGLKFATLTPSFLETSSHLPRVHLQRYVHASHVTVATSYRSIVVWFGSFSNCYGADKHTLKHIT
jgi:hypothetical protein